MPPSYLDGMFDDHLSALLSFRVLGPVQAWCRGAELELGSAQQRTTLAMLLLHEGMVVPLDALIAGMWGDEPPRSAVTTIRTYVCRLRATFAAAGLSEVAQLASVGGGYLLHTGPDAVDLSRFRRHTALGAKAAHVGNWPAAAAHQRCALDLPKGQPLAGALGPYVAGQRARLEQLVTTAQVDLCTAEINLGRHREVLPELAAMATTYPLCEDVQALFMTALYNSGRAAEALAHYQKSRRTLVDDLGIEPGFRMREVHQRILASDPPPAAPSAGAGLPRRRPSRPVWGARQHQVRLAQRRKPRS